MIGVSPAFGIKFFRTLGGIPLLNCCREWSTGSRAAAARPRIVRMNHTADTSFLGLSAARLSGSGIGIGIQAKGTAVIHQTDRLPHNNLELFSNAPITTLEHYRSSAGTLPRYARGEMPEPVVVPTKGEAMGSRYHARVALLYAIETSLIAEGAAPEEIEVSYTGAPKWATRKLTVEDYPLAEKRPELIEGRRGKRLDDITLDGLVAGEVEIDDLRITPAALRMQAEIARRRAADAGGEFRTRGGAGRRATGFPDAGLRAAPPRPREGQGTAS